MRKYIFNKLMIQILKIIDIQRKERRFHASDQSRERTGRICIIS